MIFLRTSKSVSFGIRLLMEGKKSLKNIFICVPEMNECLMGLEQINEGE
jgi:hypothetical protein